MVKMHYSFGIEVLTITVFPCSIQDCGPASQAVAPFTYLEDYFQFSAQSLSFCILPKLTKPKTPFNKIFEDFHLWRLLLCSCCCLDSLGLVPSWEQQRDLEQLPHTLLWLRQKQQLDHSHLLHPLVRCSSGACSWCSRCCWRCMWWVVGGSWQAVAFPMGFRALGDDHGCSLHADQEIVSQGWA